jgi:hypothetical protein
MTIPRLIIFILLIIGFSGIQFALFIDDPHHLIEPDPDCFICIASHSSIDINPQITIEFTPNIISYLHDISSPKPYFQIFNIPFFTRAPPYFSTL